ncbi:hypothetical protein WICMUC_003549 [Wickerhamomyces mucosus]|uniref:glutathione-specific gamma-glutamylcyclotransferase n=1 Tax=Wickerhamomyces mucosus TaxID=1378264 RepID=A0A9P8PKE5_9ASCO|nr:hypothetical protein WICMUC_003549 [Wickerhamomyces mucosus]
MTVEDKPLWVLGYGSLIFKPPPHAKFRIPGIIYNYARRFWQSSSDHRGCVETGLGRVVTLIPYEDIIKHKDIKEDVKYFNNLADDFKENDLKLWGCAYYIPSEHAQKVRDYLDIREQDGYTIHEIPFELHIDEKEHQFDNEFQKSIDSLPRDPKSGKHVLISTVYIGTLDNASFIGPEKLEKTAEIISHAKGASGPNFEYLEKLHHTLRDLDDEEEDKYLSQLLDKVVEIRNNK